MTTSPSNTQQLRRWDSAQQDRYRHQHAEQLLIIHMLLDGSGSMAAHAAALRMAYNRYLRWLKHHADPMALLDLRIFGTSLTPAQVQGLRSAPPLSDETYAARYGGTALFDSLGSMLTTSTTPGQHVLVCFTDGQDTDSISTPAQIAATMTALQEVEGWLCVFLGAYQEALEEATALGFRSGNCLAFNADAIPEAFARLEQATQKYLAASAADRKLLTAGGLFV